jgi:hypothetical protein
MRAKAERTDWDTANGLAIIQGKDAAGITHEMAVPIAAFQRLCSEARRHLSGLATKGHPPSYGQFHWADHVTAQTYNVGILPTTAGEKISLIMDRGLDTQIGFAIEPLHARELGEELLETAERASNSPQATN